MEEINLERIEKIEISMINDINEEHYYLQDELGNNIIRLTLLQGQLIREIKQIKERLRILETPTPTPTIDEK